MKPLFVAAILWSLPIVASSQGTSPTFLSREDAQKFAQLTGQKEAAAKTRLATLSNQEIAAALAANLSDKTKIIYQRGYGVYIEYTSADGRDRMWFPGNSRVVFGIWGVRYFGVDPRACFKYFNSRNAVTGEFENTECVSAKQTLSGGNVIDERPGDVFNLLSNAIPYRKDSMSIPAWPPVTDDKSAPLTH